MFTVHRQFLSFSLLVTAIVLVVADTEDQQKHVYLGEDSAMDLLQSLLKSIGSKELPHLKNADDEYKDTKNNDQPDVNLQTYDISKITSSPRKSGKHDKVDRIEEVQRELQPEFQQMQSRSGRFLISSNNVNVLNRHRRDGKDFQTNITCPFGSGCCKYNSKPGEKNQHPPQPINNYVICPFGSKCCVHINSTSGLKNKILKYIIILGLFVVLSIPQTL